MIVTIELFEYYKFEIRARFSLGKHLYDGNGNIWNIED